MWIQKLFFFVQLGQIALDLKFSEFVLTVKAMQLTEIP
jgi:hypothetical protein